MIHVYVSDEHSASMAQYMEAAAVNMQEVTLHGVWDESFRVCHATPNPALVDAETALVVMQPENWRSRMKGERDPHGDALILYAFVQTNEKNLAHTLRLAQLLDRIHANNVVLDWDGESPSLGMERKP